LRKNHRTLQSGPIKVSGRTLSFIERIVAFLDSARTPARRPNAGRTAFLGYREVESNATLFERAKAFIRSAEVRACLGVGGSGSVTDAVASR
jgi:hypothetical protein